MQQVFGDTAGRLDEDDGSVSGQIGLTQSESAFAGATTVGQWGSIVVDATGSTWTYTLDARADTLKEGEVVRDKLTLTSESGFSQLIKVKITGQDDAVVVAGAGEFALAEPKGLLQGSTILFDIDATSAPEFVAGALSGTYGSFKINEQGTWTYKLSTSGKLALGDGDVKTETFRPSVSDGSTAEFSIKVRGEDDDKINLSTSSSNHTLKAGIGNDDISTGAGADKLWGGAGRDDIHAGSGNDVVRGGDGADLVKGGSGADLILGGKGADKIYGSFDHDTIYGQMGNDRVWGGNGKDTIYLGDGNDVFYDNTQNDKNGHDRVFGGKGKDTINIGGGDNMVSGGAGADTFRIKTKQALGDNVVTDFVQGADVLKLSGVKYDGLKFVATGNGVRVEWDEGSVKLNGVGVGILSEDDFLFV